MKNRTPSTGKEKTVWGLVQQYSIKMSDKVCGLADRKMVGDVCCLFLKYNFIIHTPCSSLVPTVCQKRSILKLFFLRRFILGERTAYPYLRFCLGYFLRK